MPVCYEVRRAEAQACADQSAHHAALALDFGGHRDGAAAAAHLLLFITAVPNIKLFAWGEGDSGGHVL
jgi:hypothetical protein